MNGEGSEDEPYVIDSEDALNAPTKYLNESEYNTGAGLVFKLTEDLALPEDCDLSKFAGTLDGGGHLLTNVNKPIGGTVKNLLYHGTTADISGETNKRFYKITLPEGATATATDQTQAHTFNGGTYYESGAQLTFSVSNGGVLQLGNSYFVNGDTYTVTGDAELTFEGLPVISVTTDEGGNQSTPTLTFNTEDNCYGISSDKQLEALKKFAETEGNDTSNLIFKLTTDIELPENRTPIENFKGTLDGGYTDSEGKEQTHKISGLKAPLVNENSGTIQNLTPEVNITNGGENAGGVANTNSGTIDNVTVAGNVSGTTAGGIVGENRGNVKDCTFDGSVSGNTAGGIAGKNSGNVKDNTTDAQVTGNTAGTWIVKDTVNLENFNISGEVNLILADGGKLTANKITGGKLNVYAQSGSTGALNVTGEISSALNFFGGQVEANSISGATTLSWTNEKDSVMATNGFTNTVNFSKNFYGTDGNAYRNSSTFSGGTLKPLANDKYLVKLPEGVTPSAGIKIGSTNSYICDKDAQLTLTVPNGGVIQSGNSYFDNGDTYKVEADAEFTTIGKLNDALTPALDDNKLYYKISSAQDFTALATYVNEGNTCAGLTFKLTEDVSFSGTEIKNFAGTFDGKEHLITADGTIFNNPTGTISGYQYGTTTDAKLTQVFKVEIGGAFTGGTKVTFGNIDYYHGAITLNEGYALSGMTNERKYTLAKDLTTADLYYAVTVPDNYTLSGENKITVDGTTYYKGSVTVAPKTGFIDGGAAGTHTIDKVTTLTGAATFDTDNHYAYEENGEWKLADATTAAAHELTRVYSVTLPNYMTATSGTITIGAELYTTGGEVKFTLDGYLSGDVICGGTTLTATTEKIYTVNVTADTTVTASTFPIIGNIEFNATGKYYELEAAQDFTALATYAATNDCADLTFKLTADINNPAAIKNFAGTFDGNGHLITADGTIFNNPTGTTISGYQYGTDTDAKLTRVYKFTAPNHFKFKNTSTGLIIDEHLYAPQGNATFALTGDTLDGAKFQISGTGYTETADGYSVTLELAAGDAQLNPTEIYIQTTGTSYTNEIVDVKIVGNANDETIINNAAGVTIDLLSGGADTITVGANVTSLTLNNFTTDDKLIFNASIDSAVYDNGTLKVTAGDKEITISGMPAPTPTREEKWLTFENGTATYGKTAGSEYINDGANLTFYTANEDETYFTLTGISNKEGVTVSGKQVTVAESALDMTATQAYTVKLTGSDFTLNFNGKTDGTELPASLVNGTYTSAYTTAHFTGNGDEFIFTPATTPTTFTISGLGSGAKLGENVLVDGKAIKISAGAFTSNHDTISLTTDDGFTLAIEADSLVKTIDFTQNSNSVTLAGTTEGYKKIGAAYEWQNQIGGEVLTISGLKDGATLSADMFTRSDDQIIFKPTQDLLPENPTTISITGGVIDTSELSTSEKIPAHFDGFTWIAEKSASSWTSGTSEVTFTPASGGEELFTLSGVKNVDGVEVGDSTVKVNASNFADDTVTISGDYSLALGEGLTAPETVAANYSDGIYTTKGKSAGYVLDEKSITYTPATTKTFEFTGLSDATTAENFYIKGKTITVGKEAVRTDGTPVKLLTEGYTLKLGKGMKESETVDANYSNGVYNTKGTTDGYTLTDKTIAYVAGTSKTFEFTGIDDDATAENFYVKGSTVTIGEEAVRTDGTPVKLLTEGYTLKLGKGMTGGDYILDGNTIRYDAPADESLRCDAIDDPLLSSDNFICVANDDLSEILTPEDLSTLNDTLTFDFDAPNKNSLVLTDKSSK